MKPTPTKKQAGSRGLVQGLSTVVDNILGKLALTGPEPREAGLLKRELKKIVNRINEVLGQTPPPVPVMANAKVKIVKTASGKKAIKMSKSAWTKIGQDMGWQEQYGDETGTGTDQEKMFQLNGKINNLKQSVIELDRLRDRIHKTKTMQPADARHIKMKTIQLESDIKNIREIVDDTMGLAGSNVPASSPSPTMPPASAVAVPAREREMAMADAKMNIVKTASGKKKVKMNKAAWILIGESNGWTK